MIGTCCWLSLNSVDVYDRFALLAHGLSDILVILGMRSMLPNVIY
jgi:hypothetical protein